MRCSTARIKLTFGETIAGVMVGSLPGCEREGSVMASRVRVKIG